MWVQKKSLLPIFTHTFLTLFFLEKEGLKLTCNTPQWELPLVLLQRSVESLLQRFHLLSVEIKLLLAMTSENRMRKQCARSIQLVRVKWDLSATTLRQSNHLLLWTTKLSSGWLSWMHLKAPGTEETLHGQCPLCMFWHAITGKQCPCAIGTWTRQTQSDTWWDFTQRGLFWSHRLSALATFTCMTNGFPIIIALSACRWCYKGDIRPWLVTLSMSC